MDFPLLFKCRDCEEEVKPGEDQCWTCLGEKQEPEWFSGIDFGVSTYGAYTLVSNALTISNNTISVPTGITIMADNVTITSSTITGSVTIQAKNNVLVNGCIMTGVQIV